MAKKKSSSKKGFGLKSILGIIGAILGVVAIAMMFTVIINRWPTAYISKSKIRIIWTIWSHVFILHIIIWNIFFLR